MSGMAEHRKTVPAKSSAKGPAWGVLVTMGGTSVTLNIWDATHSAHLYLLLAILRGLAPVLAAMFLSEVGARFDGGKTFRWVTFGIMALAMVLSASAVANVLRPSYAAGLLGLILAWMFGLVLDAAALAGLWVILTERERKREAERQAAEHDAGAELAEAVAAAEDRVREESGAVIAGLREELAARDATVEALKSKRVPARKSRRTSARKPAGSSARNPAAASGPEPAQVPPGTSGPDGELDLDTEARILKYIEDGYSASKAGVMAGASDSYGRQVARLKKAAQKEPSAAERSEQAES